MFNILYEFKNYISLPNDYLQIKKNIKTHGK